MSCWPRSWPNNSAGTCVVDMKTRLLQCSTDNEMRTWRLAWSSSWALANTLHHVCYSCTGYQTQYAGSVQLILCWVMHSVFYGTCPAYLTNIVEPLQVVGKLLPHEHAESFSSKRVVKVWNSLPPTIVNFSSLATFLKWNQPYDIY